MRKRTRKPARKKSRTRKPAKTKHGAKAVQSLTERQRQCLVEVAKGRSDRQIGRTLRISEQTVHKHVEAAKKRYRARTRMRLVILALMLRQISLREVMG